MNIQVAENALQNRTVLVTGAGYGIGRTAALTYAKAGATVILLGRTQEALNETYDLIEQAGYPQAAVLPFDFASTDEEQYRELAKLIQANFGHLDGVLLNAGVLGQRTMMDNYHWETWQKVMQINANSQFLIVKHLLPLLRNAENDASVIFTTSSVGRKARAYWGAYAASKFAVEAIMQLYADELENTSDIRVNCINPGATRTTMRQAAYPAEHPEDVPTADTIMPLYLYLMSPESMAINGQSLDARDYI